VTRRLGAAIAVALQQTSKAGTQPYADYVGTLVLQPSTYKPDQCWTVDELKQIPWK
jgi:hypothetical protein